MLKIFLPCFLSAERSLMDSLTGFDWTLFSLPSTERMSPLQRVVFLPHAVSPAWAASAPLWAPCHPQTCTSTPSPSTTRYLLMSTRGPLVMPLFPHPAEWPAPTSAAWGPSLSWSLPRTGMGPLCKAELGSFSTQFRLSLFFSLF